MLREILGAGDSRRKIVFPAPFFEQIRGKAKVQTLVGELHGT